ncbi:ABC transporter substrate-binding protein [Desulfovibrio sp. OttesenSCG-928-G15]|nr:ABC transporter substrate-binding protein [Desulfovibrio sp. OttesenSCG-928-G15]
MKIRLFSWCMAVLLSLLPACSQDQKGYETLRIGLVDVAESKQAFFDDALTFNSRLALARHSDDGVIKQGNKRVRILLITLPMSTLPEAPRQVVFESVNTYGAGVILGGARSKITASMAAAAEQLRVPYIATSSSSSAATKGLSYSFSITPPTKTQALHYAAFLRDSLKARRIAMLVEEDALFNADFANELRINHVDNGGEIALQRFYSPEENLDQKLADIAGANPDAVVLNGREPGCFAVARALSERGYRNPLICVHCRKMSLQEIDEEVPVLPMPIYTLSYWNSSGISPEAERYILDFIDLAGHAPLENDVLAYDAVVLLLDAIRSATDIKPQTIRDELAKRTRHAGILGNYTLQPEVKLDTLWRVCLLDGKLGIDEILLPGINRKLSPAEQ